MLFAGPEQLEQSLDHMRQLIQLEGRREQEEMATVAQVGVWVFVGRGWIDGVQSDPLI